jgi:hypothetical protein
LSVAKTVIATFWALRVARRRMPASVGQP